MDIWYHDELKLLRYFYFPQKRQFQVPVDRSKNWRAFAVEDGSFTYSIGGVEGTASAGQVVICPPYTPFARHNEKEISFHFFIFQWGEHELKQLALSYRNQYRFFSSLTLLSNSTQLIANEQSRQRWRNHLFRDLILLHATEQLELPSKNDQLDDPLMAQARAIIELQFTQPLSIEEVADRIGLSPVQLSRRFRKTFGMNPSDFIRKLRLDKATELLNQTHLSIEEIAERCGYSSGFYFSRVFSQKMNMSPSHFRETHKL